MKKYYFILILLATLFATACVHGQNINKISSRCPVPSLFYSSVFAKGDGSIYYDPCPASSNIFSGIVDFSGATVILPGGGSPVSGSGTTNFLPIWTNGSSGILGDSPINWNGSRYNFNNTAGTAEFIMELLPASNNSAYFKVGDYTTTPTNYFTLLRTGGSLWRATGTIDVSSPFTTVGALNSGGNSTNIAIDDLNQEFSFLSTGATADINFQAVDQFLLQRTLTPGGTTGSQVINKMAGSVNFAALAADLTITNSTAGTTSLIFCTVQSNDVTGLGCRITDRAAGSFHIRLSAAATAETAVAFWVTN